MAPQHKTISERKFQVLVRKFKKLRDQAAATSVESTLETYWTYGELITQEKLLDEVGYHNAVLRDLSIETGISLRTLQQSLAFRHTYAKPPSGGDLSWSHFRVLVRLPTKKQRDVYASLAKKNEWTSKELQRAISSDLYSGGQLQKPKLERPSDASYLYKAKDIRVIDGDTLEVFVDLGFDAFTLQRIRLAQINAPEVRTAAGRAARNFIVVNLAEAKTVCLTTHKADVHGRYVAHVFLSPKNEAIQTCFQSGLHLNDLLVREGHAHLVG